MALTNAPYPCAGMMISSPNTRTWVRYFLRVPHVTLSLSLSTAPSAMHSMTKDITGKVVAVPCEANFRNDRKPGTSEISSLMYLVRAACRAIRRGKLCLIIRSTVQHVNRSLASDKSTVARSRSKDAFRTKRPDLLWSLKSMKCTPKCARH